MAAAVLTAGYFLFARLRGSEFRWELFTSVFRDFDPRWLGLSTLLILLTYVGRALRWRVMILPLRERPRFWNLLSATIIGFTAVVLFGRPGELVRPYLIATKEKVSFSSQLAAWFLERVYDLLIVLVIFGFALTQIHAPGGAMHPAIEWALRAGGWAATALGAICISILLIIRRFSTTAQSRILAGLKVLPPAWAGRLEQFVVAFTTGMQSTHRDLFVLQLVLYTFGEWAIISGAVACLFRGFPPTAGLTLVDTLVFLGFVAFGGVIQIPGIGGGFQMAAVIVLTELYGLSLEVATGIALVIWVVSWLTVVPLGLILAFREGIKWPNLRQLQEKVA